MIYVGTDGAGAFWLRYIGWQVFKNSIAWLIWILVCTYHASFIECDHVCNPQQLYISICSPCSSITCVHRREFWLRPIIRFPTHVTSKSIILN